MSCFGRRQNGNRVGNAEVCVLNSFLSLSRLDIFSVSAEFCIPHQWKQTQPTLLFVLVLCLLYLFVCLFNHYFFEPSFCFYASAGLLCKQIYSWFFYVFLKPAKIQKNIIHQLWSPVSQSNTGLLERVPNNDKVACGGSFSREGGRGVVNNSVYLKSNVSRNSGQKSMTQKA